MLRPRWLALAALVFLAWAGFTGWTPAPSSEDPSCTPFQTEPGGGVDRETTTVSIANHRLEPACVDLRVDRGLVWGGPVPAAGGHGERDPTIVYSNPPGGNVTISAELRNGNLTGSHTFDGPVDRVEVHVRPDEIAVGPG